MRIAISDVEAGVRLDRLLVDKIPGLGRAGAKRLFAEGRVRVLPAGAERGPRAQKGDVAELGTTIDVEVDETRGEAALPDASAPLEVVLETQDVVVVCKRAGQPTAPIAPDETGTIANALVARYPEMAAFGFSAREPGLVHRLDTATSGLVAAARSERAFETLVRALKEGRLDKRYLLVCEAEGLPERGTIEIPLAPHPKDKRRVYPCVHPRDVVRYAPRPATTEYETLRTAGRWALVEVRAPKAARHRIRAHFAAIGHPLAGDALYGGPRVEGAPEGHALHASRIVWKGDATLPAFAVESPLPDGWAQLVVESG